MDTTRAFNKCIDDIRIFMRVSSKCSDMLRLEKVKELYQKYGKKTVKVAMDLLLLEKMGKMDLERERDMNAKAKEEMAAHDADPSKYWHEKEDRDKHKLKKLLT